MSNYLSQPVKYSAPPTDANFELLSKVSLMQQQKYDVNHQQVQQTLDAFGAMKTLRPQDDAYIASKLNSITTQANAMGGNLANQSTSDSFISKIKSAAQDPYILNALEQTNKMNNYQKELALIRDKKPELYSDVNNKFALTQAGYKEYMEGKTDKLGNLSYSPYVDVTKNSLEKIKQLKDLRGEQTIKTPVLDSAGNSTGRTVERTIKGLTQEEIFQYFPDLLTASENNQLVIDGWNKYKDVMPVAQEEFKNYTTSKEALINEDIKQAQAIIDNTTNTESKRAEAKERVKSLNIQKSNLTSLKQSIDLNNPVQLGGYLHQKSFKDGIASMAQAKWSEEYGVDNYFFDKANLDINKEKLEIEKEKLQIEKNKDVVTPTADAISISAKEGELPSDINPVKQLQGDYNETYNEMVAITKGAYNSDRTTDEMRKQFKSEMNRMGYDENGVVINQALANKNSKASAFKMAFAESNMNYIHGDVSKKLSGLEARRSALANEFGSAVRTSLSEGFKGNENKYIQSLKDEMYTASVDAQSDLFEGLAGEDMKKYKKAETFVNANGGWDALKSNLSKNPQKLEEFSNILDELANRPVRTLTTNILRQNLKEDTNDLANQKLVARTKEGKNVYFNTAEIATIKDEKLRKNIVNMLPQDADTALFDSKNPMSFYKNADGSITIKQNKGYTTGKEQVAFKDAEVKVDKEDAAYKELLKYIDLTEKGRGLDASRTKIEVKPYRAPFYIDDNNGAVVSQVDKHMTTLPPNTLKGFIASPANYITKERTEDIYKAALKDKVSNEKVEAFTNKLFSNIGQFKVKLTPFDNTWAIEIIKPDGGMLVKGDTGIAKLEDDMSDLVENYPQTLISDWILRTLVKNPKQIDTLLQ